MTYLSLFLSFMKVGLFGFGGGLAIVRLIYDSIQQFASISLEEFTNFVAISQITPGPLAINIATFIGYETAGMLGGAVATIGVAFPAFIIVNIVCRMLDRFQSSIIVKGIMEGIKPATIGLIGAAAVTLTVPAIAGEGRIGAKIIAGLGTDAATKVVCFMKNSPVDIIAILILIATVILIQKFNKKPIAVLIVMGCIGALLGV